MVLVKLYNNGYENFFKFVDIPLNEEVTLEFKWGGGGKTTNGKIIKVDKYYYFKTGAIYAQDEYMYLTMVEEDGKIVGAILPGYPHSPHSVMEIWDSEDTGTMEIPSSASTGEEKVSVGGKRRRRKKRTKKKRKKRKKRRKRKTKKRRRTKRKN